MTPRGWATLVLVLVLLLGGGVLGLFVVQNSLQTAQLSLDLGFAAWKFSNPVPVVSLLGGAFGGGLLLSGLPLLVRSWRLSSENARLRQDLAFADRNSERSGKSNADKEWR